MKTAIIYATRHGCTENCANQLKEGFQNSCDMINIKKIKKVSLADYETVVIGGSIHAGRVQSKIKKFCEDNLNALMQKRLGLFLCCMEQGDKAEAQFSGAFPAELRNHAIATEIFGGEFNFEKMNPLERVIIRKVADIEISVSNIDQQKIKEFVNVMNG
ncbi:flavodoxin [candidate division KSB1 bacterium]|nr:flavodoxin [candidate division KSB1 bacterium]